MEPWEPKVGQRIRFVGGDTDLAGLRGTIVKEPDNIHRNWIVELDDGQREYWLDSTLRRHWEPDPPFFPELKLDAQEPRSARKSADGSVPGSIYAVGHTTQLSASFEDANGTPYDPSKVRLRLRGPDGVETARVYGTHGRLQRTGVGEYVYDLKDPECGEWCYRWETDVQALPASYEGELNIVPEQGHLDEEPTEAVDPTPPTEAELDEAAREIAAAATALEDD